MFETIRTTTDARGVARLILNRPEKHNAMNSEMIAEITQVAQMLGEDWSVRAVVLEAEGKSFCAGGDLAWMKAQMAADSSTRGREARKLAEMLRALNQLPKPLIGRVQGPAYGGGVGIMSVCDVVIASRSATFALTETRLGLIPATIGPYVIARMGETMARRVFMSARLFDAEEAVSLGLVARAVDNDALDAAIEAEITPYFACAPRAVARAKSLAQYLGSRIEPQDIDHSIAQLVACWEDPEAEEGISAFFARRRPRWAQ